MMTNRIKWGFALLMLGLLALTPQASRSASAADTGLHERPGLGSTGLDLPQQTEPPDDGYPPPTELPEGEDQAGPEASPTAYPPPAPTVTDPLGLITPAPDIFEPAEDPGVLPPPPDAQAEETPQPDWVRNTLILWIGFVGGLLVLSGGIFASILLYSRRNE